MAIAIPVAFGLWWLFLWGVVHMLGLTGPRWFLMPVVVGLEWCAGIASGLIGYMLVAPYEPDLSLSVGLTLIGTGGAAISVLILRLWAAASWGRAAAAAFIQWSLAGPASCLAFYGIIRALPW